MNFDKMDNDKIKNTIPKHILRVLSCLDIYEDCFIENILSFSFGEFCLKPESSSLIPEIIKTLAIK